MFKSTTIYYVYLQDYGENNPDNKQGKMLAESEKQAIFAT